MKRIYVGLSVLGMSLLVVFPQELPPEVISYADMILYNGQVLTMDRDGVDFSVTQAVAIRDGRIMATGTDDRILRMAGPRTQKLDLAGTVVMPGAWDTHVHPEGMAKNHFQNDFRRQLLALDLYKSLSIPSPQWNDLPGSLARIRKLAQTAKPGQWVVVTTGQEIEPGDRYHAKSLRAEFDKIAPSNPLVLLETTTHAVVNSVALDMVLKKYRNLRGVFKDDEGNPTGYLYGGARGAVQELIPKPPPDLFISAFRKELEEWAAKGVTTIVTRLFANDITAYSLLDRQGEMPIRIAYLHRIAWWNPMPERDLRNMGGLEGHGTDMLWMTGIAPAPPDDAPDEEGGVCTEAPKLRALVTDVTARRIKIGEWEQLVSKDLYPNGLCRWREPGGEVSLEAVVAGNKLGYRVAGVHTYGDEGILDMFDAFEEAAKDRPVADRRFAIDHVMMISPKVIERAKSLGIIWSVNPQMAEGPRSDLTMMTYGETIADEWLQPTKSLIDAGLRVMYGSDTHGDRSRPMFGLEYMVTRKNHRGVVYGAKEAIDRATGLLMMTRWAAEYAFREHELGTIEPGMIADLIVLDKNPLDEVAVTDDQLSDVRVLMTLVGAKIKFTAPDFAAARGLPVVGYQGRF